jgi:hypothetical protein
MKMQRVMLALALGLGIGYAALAFVNWSFNLMEWNEAQRGAVLIIAVLITGIMEGGEE